MRSACVSNVVADSPRCSTRLDRRTKQCNRAVMEDRDTIAHRADTKPLLLSFVSAALLLLVADIIWGFPPRPDHVLGRDFVNMWLGARTAVGFDLYGLFDWPLYVAKLRAAFGPAYPIHNWSYPPHLLLFTWPLGFLSYYAAFAVWCMAGYAAFAWAARAALERARIIPRNPALLLALAAPAAVANVIFGQIGLFVGALFVGGLALRDRRPILAGVLFGILTIKPQIGFLIPILLLVERRWKVIASAAATTAALALAASLAFGWSVFADYLRLVGPAQYAILMTGDNLQSMVPTPFVGVRTLGLPADAGWWVLALTLPAAIASVILAARRRDDTLLSGSMIGVGAFLATPYAFIYDMTILAPFVAARLLTGKERGGHRLLLFLVFLIPYYSSAGEEIGVPVAALVLLAFAASNFLALLQVRIPEQRILE